MKLNYQFAVVLTGALIMVAIFNQGDQSINVVCGILAVLMIAFWSKIVKGE